MYYIEAPNEYDGDGHCIFLAGSVSDEQNWQSQLIASLGDVQVTVFNPRRKEFPAGNRMEEQRQIEWERRLLAQACLVAVWLTPPTPCPIALFELGACCESGVPLAVGIDPNYVLRHDIVTHLHLRRPDIAVCDTLDKLTHAIMSHPALLENPR